MTTFSASAAGTTSLPDLRVIGVGRPRRAVPRKTSTQRISAGERQPIALDRALLRRPSLLLDVATCSLDAASGRPLLTRLVSLEPRPTILFVSHRTQSFALCGRVIDLAEGRTASIRRVQ